MSLMSSLNISASGMSAQRTRMDIIAQNVANVNTTRDENGEPYVRKTVVFAERANNFKNFESYLTAERTGISYKNWTGTGVKITGIAEDHVTAMKTVYDPAHPDANEEGYVTLPNVNKIFRKVPLGAFMRALQRSSYEVKEREYIWRLRHLTVHPC